MGTAYKMRVDFTIDDWTWLCHLLNDALHKKQHCEDCKEDLRDVLGVIEQADAIRQT